MFKYISEILSKFTQRQRIVALVILLISIIIISVGPKITESLTYDDKELKLRIESQNTHIIELNQRVNELNTQVINNQRECVNEIVRRETEILEIINEIWKFRNETQIPVCFTLDAGANVHVLYPEQVKEEVLTFIKNNLVGYCQNGQYICDEIGFGSTKI